MSSNLIPHCAIKFEGVLLKNYLKITLRNLLKYKTYSAINVLGLTVGLFSTILIVLFVRDELSYDIFHEKAERIYRVVTEAQNAGGTFSQLARVAAPWGPMLERELPEVEAMVRLRSVRRSLLQNGDKIFYESGGLYADPQFFEIFSLDFLAGEPATALAAPNAMVLTESLARKLFGEQAALGQQVTLNGRGAFIVGGVLADLPNNTHFHFDFLLPREVHARIQPRWQTDWGAFNYYLYLLLAPGADAASIESKLSGLLAKHVSEAWAAELRPYLQPLTSIHLHSDLSGEFEPNSSAIHVYILSAIATLILVVACINFMNLATARRASHEGNRCAQSSRRQRSQYCSYAVIGVREARRGGEPGCLAGGLPACPSLAAIFCLSHRDFVVRVRPGGGTGAGDYIADRERTGSPRRAGEPGGELAV